MWSAIGGVILQLLRNPAVWQVLALVLKNYFEKDAEEREKKKALYEKAKTAIASRDTSAINNVLSELRKPSA